MKVLLFLYSIIILLSISSTFADSDSLYEEDYGIDENQDEAEEEAFQTASEWTRKLETDVIRKVGRSPPYTDKRMNVVFRFSTLDHFYLNEKEQMMYLTGVFCMSWQDNRLLWDPDEFNGIKRVMVGPYDLWAPKLRILASASGVRTHMDAMPGKMTVFVIPRKQAAFVATCPRLNVKVGCSIDLSNYPRDQHNCSFSVSTGSWRYLRMVRQEDYQDSEYVISLKHVLTGNDTRPTVSDFTITNVTSAEKTIPMYDVTKIQEIRPRNPIRLASVAYQQITFVRHAPYYFSTILLPSMVFSAISFTAAITIHLTQSILLYCVNLLLIGVFLSDMVEELPLYYDSTPRIVIFWGYHMALCLLGLLITVTQIIYRGVQLETTKKTPTSEEMTKNNILYRVFSCSTFLIVVNLFSYVVFYI